MYKLFKDSAYLFVGYTALLILLLFSVLFYLERTCFLDVALQTFYIIETKNVAIQVHRFGAALIHIFPLITVLLELPLKTVLLSYSSAFIIENLVLFFIIHKFLKQPKIALILALYNILLVTETFYWTTSEIKQGISFSILFAAVILSIPIEKFDGLKKNINIIFQISLLVTLVFFHPLIVILLFFLLGYFLINKSISIRSSIIYAAIIISIVLLKYLLLPIPDYDKGKYSGGNNFLKYFPNYFALESFTKMLRYLIKDYYLYLVILFSVVVYYLLTKNFIKLIWLLAFTIGYTLLINVTHPNGADKFYIESFYLMLGVFILFPFIKEILPKMNESVGLIMICTIFILRLNTIYHAHKPYTARIDWNKKMLATHEGKFMMSEYHVPMDILKMTWATSYETLLLTSLNSPENARSFIILENLENYYQYGYEEDLIYGAFGGMHRYKDLNEVYFKPEKGTYRIIDFNEVIKP